MPDISAAVALLERPISIVTDLATGKAKDVLARLKAERRVKTIHQKLYATQKVKTIWDVDRARSINSFYFPAKVKTSQGVTQPLLKIDELPGNAVILSGIVGQGKSILLRYLLGKEIRGGERVPLFIELRKVASSNLKSYLKAHFNELMEITGHPEIFELFATNGRLAILLDGFDEIDQAKMTEMITSIEELALHYPTSRLVVTSRPASGLETSPHFEVVHIAQLATNDFAGFFHKILPRDKELADRITKAIISSPTQVKALATTPLLATLLTVVYRSNQRIPADFAEFYSDLFEILLVRHDRSKAYNRKRKTKIEDREIQQIFEAFCFKSHAEGPSSLTRQKALELARMSIAAQELTCSATDFLEDVIKVTCLLQEEGGRIEFLHQSVREFFAARYVSTRPDDVAKKFYDLVSNSLKRKSWDQVLRFLAQLDKYRSSQFFFIPALQATLARFDSLGFNAPATSLRAGISDKSGIRQTTKKLDGTLESQPRYTTMVTAVPDPVYHWDQLHARLFALFFGTGGFAGSKWVNAFDKVTNGQFRTYTELAVICGCESELDAGLIAAIEELRGELHEHEARVAVLDSSVDFMGL